MAPEKLYTCRPTGIAWQDTISSMNQCRVVVQEFRILIVLPLVFIIGRAQALKRFLNSSS